MKRHLLIVIVGLLSSMGAVAAFLLGCVLLGILLLVVSGSLIPINERLKRQHQDNAIRQHT